MQEEKRYYHLYSFRRCPYAIRARLALEYSKIPYSIIEVSLKNKPPSLLEVSPKGTVPVLYSPKRDFIIEESWDIMRWALEQHDPDGLWQSQGADLQRYQEAQLELIEQNDKGLKPWLDRYKYPNRFLKDREAQGAELATEAQAQDYAFEQAGKILSNWEQRLEKHAFLLGEGPSLADMALLSFVRQFAGVEPQRLQRSFPNLACWLERGCSSPAFLKIMDKSYAGTYI